MSNVSNICLNEEDNELLLGWDTAVEVMMSLLDTVQTNELELDDGSRMSRSMCDMVLSAVAGYMEAQMDVERDSLIRELAEKKPSDKVKQSDRHELDVLRSHIASMNKLINRVESEIPEIVDGYGDDE
jgi:hypothetical protein